MKLNIFQMSTIDKKTILLHTTKNKLYSTYTVTEILHNNIKYIMFFIEDRMFYIKILRIL